MIAHFYENKSDERYINKSLTNIETNVTIHFKDESEVVNPTLYISPDINIKNVNYIYIPTLHRYYYVREIKLEHQRYVVNCHVDVLMSFSSEIRSCNAVLERSQKNTLYNVYLDDAEMSRLLGDQVVTLPFPKGFVDDNGDRIEEFILCLNGG